MSKEKKPKRQEISPGIFMEKFQERDQQSQLCYFIRIEIENFEALEFTVDFTGSSNVRFEDQADLVKKITLQPYSQITVAKLILDKGWNLKTKFKFLIVFPDVQIQRDKLVPFNKAIEADRAAARSLPPLQNLSEPKRRSVLSKTTAFTDVSFPPSHQALGLSEQELLAQVGCLVHWRRANQGLSKNPGDPVLLFSPQSNWAVDVKLGKLTNGGVISAIAALAEKPKVIQRVFITKELSDKALYAAKVCCFGKWRQFLVDDYVPCVPLGEPLFAGCLSNALWISLLEKTIAKKYGNYQNLSAVGCQKALADLSGCPTYEFRFSSPAVKEQLSNGALWSRLRQWKEKKFLVVAELREIEGEPAAKNIKDFGYSIIRVEEYKGNKLLCIRNQWGIFDWNGAWSWESADWTPDSRKDLNAVDEDPLLFWMSWADFQQNFRLLWLCQVSRWEELFTVGKFVTSFSDKDKEAKFFCSRWYYSITIEKPSRVVVGLHQSDNFSPESAQVSPFVDLSFSLLTYNDGKFSLHSQIDQTINREIFTELHLEAGEYFVVPRSAGLLMHENMHHPTIAPAGFSSSDPLVKAALEDLFRKLDVNGSNSLTFAELQLFFQLMSQPLEQAQFQKFVSAYQPESNDLLFFEGFCALYDDLFSKNNKEALAAMWDNLGYNKQFFSFRSRAFMLSFHSDEVVHMTVKDALKDKIDAEAARLTALRFGRPLTDAAAVVQLLCHVTLEHGFHTYVVVNNTETPVVAKIDFSKSRNMEIGDARGFVSVKVAPKESVFAGYCQVFDPKKVFDATVLFTWEPTK